MPRSPSMPTPRANFISNPSERALGHLALWPHQPRGVRVFKDFIHIKWKEAAVSRGDQGEEVTRVWALWEGFSPVCAPVCGLSHGVRGTPACLEVLPLRAGQGSRDQAGHAKKSSGPRAGLLGPVQSAQVWPRPGQGKGPLSPNSDPISLSCTRIPDSWRQRRKTAMEFSPSFPS